MDTATDSTAADVTARQSRRRFFAMGASALGAIAATSSSVAEAQPPKAGGRTLPLPSGVTPGGDVALQWKDPLLRLVRRASMGLSPSEVALARQRGYTGYLEYQLNAEAIDDSELEALIATRTPMLSMTGAQLRTQDANEVKSQLFDAAWYRALFSKRQLKERMVEFWTDHLNMDIDLDAVSWRKVLDDRDVIRPNALGNFRTLLTASAHSAAMLQYLNQTTSRTPTPNQNYAREIMELHTLGVDGGYTQTDVAELSRILTGWSATGDGAFAWNRAFHDRNAKTFLGRSFPAMLATATDAQMKGEGDLAIEMLLDHASTARYVSYKMARFLLAYEPPTAVVDATAAAYTRTRGDIKTMIRTILTSQNLSAAPAKYKRPFHLGISAMLAMGATPATVPNLRGVRGNNENLGMRLFRWPQPDGFPDSVVWWSGLVMSRWQHLQFLSAQSSTTTYRVDSMMFRSPDTPDGVLNQMNARLFAGEMPASMRSALSTYLRGAAYSDARVRETLSLALSANEFQWY